MNSEQSNNEKGFEKSPKALRNSEWTQNNRNMFA